MQKRFHLLFVAILVIALLPAFAPRQSCSPADPGCLYCSEAVIFDCVCFHQTVQTSLSQEVQFPRLDIIPVSVASRAPPR